VYVEYINQRGSAMKTVAIIPVLGEMHFEELEKIEYDFLREAIGGVIESVPLSGLHSNMYLHEEGKLEGLDLNTRATRLAWHEKAISRSDFIVGDVVLTGGVDDEGEDVGLDPEQVEWLKDAFE
jgi:hypothetical protein